MPPIRPYFDQLLYQVLEQVGKRPFTTLDLRDAYAGQLPGVEINRSALRKHIYRHIKKMISAGWVIQDKNLRKRRQIYHLVTLPRREELKLFDNQLYKRKEHVEKSSRCSAAFCESPDELPGAEYEANLEAQLETFLKEAQLDFLAAMGEAERLKQIIKDIPSLKDKLEGTYIDARDRSSRLLGHLRAVEKTISLVRS